MASGNFFGLFGYTSASDDESISSKEKNRYTTGTKDGDLEDGEIADCQNNEQLQMTNSEFENLLTKYQDQMAQQSSRKKNKQCFICVKMAAKYTCPKCGIRTCSLNCCLSHKKQFDCDGVRDRLSFVPLKNFTDINLNSDCEFLFDTSDKVGKSARSIANNQSQETSNWVIRFRQEASKRNIHYQKLPATFKKAKLNRSIYVYKDKLLLWDVEFVLPYCKLSSTCDNDNEDFTSKDSQQTDYSKLEPSSSSEQTYHSITIKRNRISEHKTFREVLKDLFDNESEWRHELEDSQEQKLLQISEYKQASEQELVALFRHDSGKFYYMLDLDKSLARNFAYKTIVEYPIVVVVFRAFLHQYLIRTAPVNDTQYNKQ